MGRVRGWLTVRYLAARDFVQTVVFVPVFVVMVGFFYLKAVGKYLFLGIRDYDFLQ